MTLIVGAERRRRWSADERQRILAAANAPGAVVAEVSRSWDVCTSLICKWRHNEVSAARASGFAPVRIVEKGCAPARAGSAMRVEATAIVVELGGALVRIGWASAAGLDHGDAESAAVMISAPSGVRVWIGTGHTDMRRGMRGLALQVQEG